MYFSYMFKTYKQGHDWDILGGKWHCHIVIKHCRWLKYDIVTSLPCTVVALCSGLWLIVKSFLSVSLSLCTRPIVVCKDHVLAYHCGIPLSYYRLHPSPDPPTAAFLPLHIPTQPMCFKQSGNGNIPPLIHAHTDTYSFLLCSGPCRTGVGVGLVGVPCSFLYR